MKRRVLSKVDDLNDEKNPYYSRKLIKYLVNYLMVYVSLCKAAGIAEPVMQQPKMQLKKKIFSGEEKISIPRVVLQNEKCVGAKIKDRVNCGLLTNRQMKGKDSQRSEKIYLGKE